MSDPGLCDHGHLCSSCLHFYCRVDGNADFSRSLCHDFHHHASDHLADCLGHLFYHQSDSSCYQNIAQLLRVQYYKMKIDFLLTDTFGAIWKSKTASRIHSNLSMLFFFVINKRDLLLIPISSYSYFKKAIKAREYFCQLVAFDSLRNVADIETYHCLNVESKVCN